MNEIVPASDAAERTFYTFRAENRLYGIEVAFVREVSTHVAVTPVPQAPPVVRGLTNLRSRIFLVLDPRPALGMAVTECTPESRLVVLQAQVAEHLGLMVDRGGEIVRVAAGQIEDSDRAGRDAEVHLGDVRSSLVVGVCKLENELMMIIDPMRLVETARRAIG